VVTRRHLRTTLDEVRAAFQRGGARTVAIKALQELGLYRRLDLVDVPLAPKPMRGEASRDGLVARELEATASDLAAYARFRPDVPAGQAAERLRRGERCYLVDENGEILSAVWTTPAPVRLEYLECTVQIAPPDVYGYDSFTLASRRGEDLATLRSELMKATVRREGWRRLIATQLAENVSQGRRAARFGYRRLGVIGWYGVGSWRRLFVRVDDDADPPLAVAIVAAR
jgi:hypothetical protein